MKRKFLGILLILNLLFMISAGAFAQAPIKLWMNGQYLETDAAPVIENGRTLVPLRVISEALGYHVNWNKDTQTVLILEVKDGLVNEDGKSLAFTIGEKQVMILNAKDAVERDSLTVDLDVAAKIVNDRTFVPIRFIAEEYGLKVDWDNDNRTVVIGEGYTAPTSGTDEPKITPTPKPTEKPAETPEVVTKEFTNALAQAQLYVDNMHMSKKRLYVQLTSEYGERFATDAAQYAVDHVQANWNENALKTAEGYSTQQHLSKQRIYDQLTSEFGEQFLPAEAQYAIDHIKADWNFNALQTAISYRDNMNMSEERIREQLTSQYGEKFTQAEADWAIANLP